MKNEDANSVGILSPTQQERLKKEVTLLQQKELVLTGKALLNKELAFLNKLQKANAEERDALIENRKAVIEEFLKA